MFPAKTLTGPALRRTLVNTAAQNDWPFSLFKMSNQDTLLVDRGALAIVQSHAPADGPKLTPVGQFDASGVPEGGRVFVLAQNGERRTAKRLEAKHPDIAIQSVCYGESLDVIGIKKLFHNLDVTMMVSSQVCGAEYLAALLDKNNLAQVCPAVDDVMILWAQYASDFSMRRRLVELLSQAKKRHPKRPVLLAADLDQMDVLRLTRLLPPKPIKRITDRLNIGCLYMMRRNKAMQSAAILGLEKICARGVQEASASVGWQPARNSPALGPVLSVALELVSQECRFERYMNNLNETRAISFEELETNPVAVLSMLALYLGQGTLRKARVVDPKPYDLRVDWQQEFQASFKSHIEAFIGVGKNQVGSYDSKMNLR